MSARAVRALVLVVCAAGIAGMIVASVAGHDGAALTFGLLTAAAVACLIVATAVGQSGSSAPTAQRTEEGRAARVDALVHELVTDGADEAVVRALVAEAGGLRPPPGDC